MDQNNNGLNDLNHSPKDTEINQTSIGLEVAKFDELQEQLQPEDNGLFEIQTANEVIEQAINQPNPVQLYEPLILENEFIILFADTGVGKTVLSFQMAIDIARQNITVLYLDLELSKKQFQKRYTSDENGKAYLLPDNLYRVGFARLKKVPKELTYEAYFFESLISAIHKTGAKVVFLDNLTKLAAGDTDSAKNSIPILEKFNDLKADFGLTIIVLEHNKKVDTSRPIQLNDLQGSKMKSNLVDAVFTIGRSAKDKNIRYIKQLKVRDGEVVYDTENVKVCELSKVKGYLSFTDIGFSNEFEHLKEVTEKDRENLIEKIKELHKSGKSFRAIGDELKISHMKASRIIKTL